MRPHHLATRTRRTKTRSTEPKTESTARASGKGTIARGSCLIVFPPDPEGDAAFFEAEGEWQLVRDDPGTSKVPDAARRGIADAEEASADALSKLTLK